MVAINTADLLLATVDRKLIKVMGGNAVEIMKHIGLHPAEARTISVNLAFTGVVIKMNAPTILTHKAQVVG